MRRKVIMRLAPFVAAVLLLAFGGATAAASPRKLCYANSQGVVMAKNMPCSKAEDVAEVAVDHMRSHLRPFTIHIHGTWRCHQYIHGRFYDIVCRQGRKVAGIAVKP